MAWVRGWQHGGPHVEEKLVGHYLYSSSCRGLILPTLFGSVLGTTTDHYPKSNPYLNPNRHPNPNPNLISV